MELPEIPTADDVTSLLRREYRGCAGLRGVRPLSRGRNAIFEMEIGSTCYVVKSSRTGDATARLARHAMLTRELAAVGASTEQVMLTSAEQLVGRGEDGLVVAVYRKIEGATGDFSRAGYAQLGAALAQWHRAAMSIKVDAQMLSTLSPSAIVSRAESALLATRSSDPEECAGFGRGRVDEQRLSSCLDFLRDNLPREGSGEDRIGHGDPHPLNLFRSSGADGGQQFTWIDLEDAYWGSRLHDLGTVVWSTLRHHHTQPLWAAALEAYSQELQISSHELDQLGYYVALRQLWWLALHARHWGQYDLHVREPRLLEAGLDLLELICREACGARLPVSPG